MNTQSKDNIVISTLAITMSSSAALVPVLSSIADVFPNYSHLVHLLITIPPLMIMISSMLVSPLLKFFSVKSITISGLVLIIFSGVYPYFSNSFLLLLISRAIMGVGLGFIFTISSSLPATYFKKGAKRDKATGLQSAFSSFGGILFSFLSGFIANYYWKGVFLVQLLNLVPLIVVVFFMKSTLSDKIVVETPVEITKGKIFVKEALGLTLLAFVYVFISATFPLNLSLYVSHKSIGTTSLTGTIASINSFIGFIIGIMFQRINKGLKKYTLPTSLIMVGISFYILSISSSPPLFMLGSTLFGIGTSLMYPAFLTSIYNTISDEDIVPAIGMYTLASNIAQFVSPFLIKNLSSIIGPGIEDKFVFCFISMTLIGILLSLKVSIKPKTL